MSVGGSIEIVTINGREFPATADSDSNRKLGGFENEVQMNGNGTGRMIKTRVACMFSGLVLECDDDRGDHEFLQDISNGKEFVACVVTLASGAAYQGQMTIQGELQYSTQNTTATCDLAGPGTLTRQ